MTEQPVRVGTLPQLTRFRLSLTNDQRWPHVWRSFGPLGIVASYALWSAAVVYSIGSGNRARLLLLLLPLVLLVVHQVPRFVLVGMIPVATFGQVVLPELLSQRIYLLVIAVAGLGVVTRRWTMQPRFHMPVIALAVVVVLSAWLTDPSTSPYSFRSFAVLTSIGLLMCGAAALIRPTLEAVAVTLVATGALVSVVVLAGWFIDPRTAAESARVPVELRRVSALGLNPNYLALIIVVGAIAAVGLAFERRRFWILLAVIPCLGALPSLKSRGPLLLLLVGLIWVLVAAPGRRTRRVSIAALALGCVMLFRPTIWGEIYRSVLGGRADADLATPDQVRFDVARFAIELGFDNPLLGAGYGQFPVNAGTRFILAYPSAHNEYLHVFSELGLIGIGLMVIVMLRVGQAVRRCTLPVTAGAVLATYAVAMLSIDSLYSLPTSMGVLVLAGAVAGDAHRRFAVEPDGTREDENERRRIR